MSAPSPILLDHFRNPRHAGSLPDATASGSAENLACGDVVRIDIRIERDRIAAARFLAQGCPATIGAASWVTSNVNGREIVAARALDANTVIAAVGELNPARQHGIHLALRALGAALDTA